MAQTLFQDGYRALKAGEQAAFTISPIPLKPVKSGIQHVGIPLIVAGVAAHSPFAGPAINAVIHQGGRLAAAGFGGVTQFGLNAVGGAIEANLPTGFGVQSIAHGLGGAISAATRQGVDATGYFVGNLSTAVVLGRSAIKAVRGAVTVPIKDLIADGQRTIQKVKQFLSTTREKVNKFIQGRGQSMSDFSGFKAQPVEGGKQFYRDALRTGQSFEQLKAISKTDPKEGELMDLEVAKNAKAQELSADRVINAIAEGPNVQAMKEQGIPIAAITDYLADLQSRYMNNDLEPPTESPELNQPNNSEPEIDPEAKAVSSSKVSGDSDLSTESSREAEDYFINTIKDGLARARLEVGRFEVRMDGKTVFGMKDGEIDQSKTAVSNAHMEAMKQALTDTENFTGTVKITQGSQVLLHIKDGRVLQDVLGLAEKPSAKIDITTQAPDSFSDGMYQTLQKEVAGTGLKATEAIASAAISKGMGLAEVKQMLAKHDTAYKDFAQKQGEGAANQLIANASVKSQPKVDGQQRRMSV